MADDGPGSLFARLPGEAEQELRRQARRRRFAAGEVIFHEGEAGRHVHVVEQGHVAIRVTTPMGDAATLTVLGPPAMFGDQVLFAEDAERTASAVALEGAETLALSAEQVHELRDTFPAVQELLLDTMAATVRRLSDHLVEALYLPADRRVLRRLASAAAVYTTPTIPVTQEDIAHMAGVSRATANRTLKELEGAGAIRMGRGRIEVLDLDSVNKASGW